MLGLKSNSRQLNQQYQLFVPQLGRSERIRTSDPLVPNEVRYQTALHSDNARLIDASDARRKQRRRTRAIERIGALC